MASVSNKVTLKQIKLLFGPLFIQLVWYILKQSKGRVQEHPLDFSAIFESA